MIARTMRSLVVAWPVLCLALLACPACTSAYMDTLEEDMALAPPELLALRTEQARESLGQARVALLHLDDGLRQFALEPLDAPEQAQADLERLAERAQAAAWDARRRIASVSDVAPAYLRGAAGEPAPAARPYDDLARALGGADRSLLMVTEVLESDLGALGDAPSPRAADALREPIAAALASIARAIDASGRFVRELRERGTASGPVQGREPL